MPPSKRGRFEANKSAWTFESYDSDWERQYMEELDEDPAVFAWTKRHEIRIPYEAGGAKRRIFRPDFLVKLRSGRLELRETKGGHLLKESELKFTAAREWCAARGMSFVVVTKGRLSR
jgi:TnsA-like endonuclease N terminal